MSDYIDLIKLKANYSAEEWNVFLTNCHRKHKAQRLTSTLNQIQRGMDKLVKDKMNTEEMQILFVRLQRSIEITLKKIWREQNKNPNYDPLKGTAKGLEEKRRLDQEIEAKIRKASLENHLIK